MKRIIYQFYHIAAIILLSILTSCTNITTYKPSHKLEIALMLPLSGPQEDVGKRLDMTIREGFKAANGKQFSITSYDTSNQKLLAESLSKIQYKNTKIIIGPLFSKDTKFAANKIKHSDTVIISLSNDPGLSQLGVFVYGHAPKKQNLRLIEYYLSQGYTNFITLFPAGSYFQNFNKELLSLIVENNGIFVRGEFYSSDPNSIDSALRNVNIAVDRLNEDDQNFKKPVLLISDDPKHIEELFNQFLVIRLDQKAEIAGDWRINNDATSYLEYSFTGSSEIVNDNDNFGLLQTAVNSQYPTQIEYIAYDLGKIITNATREQYSKNAFIQNLQNMPKFNGIGGHIKFEGFIAVRDYDIIKHKNGKYEVLEAARN